MKVSAEVCPLCEGTGWKTVSAERDRRVTRCDCRLQARTRSLLAAARIPKRYEHCELSEFDTRFEGAHCSLEGVLLEARSFVTEYPVENSVLLLICPISVGKTHLAVGILDEPSLQKLISCHFYDYHELLT